MSRVSDVMLNRSSVSIVQIVLIHLYTFLLVSPVLADVPRFAYVANPYDYTISKYYIDETGRMFPNGMVFTRDKFPSALAVHPSGKYLFTATRTVDTAPIYRIDAVTGWLSEIEDSHFNTRLRSPFAYSFHPSGKFLYLAGRGGGVAGLKFDESTEKVSYVPGSPFSAGERTRCLTVHPSGKFVYATNAYSNNISAYRIDQSTGELTELSSSPVPAGEEGPFDDTFAKLPDVVGSKGGMPYYVAAHPSGDFLYVTNWAAASISVFRVNQESGDLKLVGLPKETGLTPYAVAAHPSGNYVMATSWGANDVWVYSVDKKTGQLTNIEGSPFGTYGMKPVDISFNDNGTLAYVANVSSNNVSIFDVDVASGKLTLKDFGVTRSGSIDVEVVPLSPLVLPVPKFAFIVDKESNYLRVYRINGITGDLTEVSKAKTEVDPVMVANDPLNRFVYVVNAGSNSVSAFRVDKNSGTLSEIEGSPYQVGENPQAIKIDANGWYLYALNRKSETMSVFLIHVRTGQLAEVQGSPVVVNKQPNQIITDPTSRFVYVNNNSDNSISAYRFRTAITPSIFEIKEFGSPFVFSSFPTAINVDPTGRFAMILEAEKNQATMRFVHVGSGALEPIKNNGPFKLDGKGAKQSLFHPNSRFAYVLNESSKSISQLAVERLWGKLSSIAEPQKIGGVPEYFTIDPSGQFIYVAIKGQNSLLRYKVDGATGKLSAAGKIDVAFPPQDMTISREFHLQQN